jgi:assimilatory nitrate reductase catalytic subunit
MARRGLKDGDLVHLTSRRGSIVLPVQGSEQVGLSQAFLAMHWGGEFLSGASGTDERLAGVNALTTPAFCPTSKQPELKHAAVKVLKAELPWTLLAAAWLPVGQAHRAIAALRELMPRVAYASCVPFGREPSERGVLGVLFRAAAVEPPGDEWLAHIEEALGLAGAEVLRYVDGRRGQRRAMRLVPRGDGREDARLEAFVLAGDTRAESWVRALLQDEGPAQAYGRALLAPGAKPPATLAPRSRQVCTCLNVTEGEILATLAQCQGSADERLARLQAERRCGTQCGSCVPELRRLVRTSLQAA